MTARTLTAPAPVADAGGVPCASVAPVEAPQIEREFESEIEASPSRAWATVVWNDPINLMSYVTWVFMTHFGYDRAHAETLMWQVHTAGKSKVSEGGRERMEADVAALHSYGLWATLEECG